MLSVECVWWTGSATLFQLSEAARWRRGAPPTPRPGELGGDRSALLLGGRCEAMVRGVVGREIFAGHRRVLSVWVSADRRQ